MKSAMFLLYQAKIKTLMRNYYSSNQCVTALETLDEHDEYESAVVLSSEIYKFCQKKYRQEMTKKEMKGRYLDTLDLFYRLVDLHAEMLKQIKKEFRPYVHVDITFEDLITMNNQLFALL